MQLEFPPTNQRECPHKNPGQCQPKNPGHIIIISCLPCTMPLMLNKVRPKILALNILLDIPHKMVWMEMQFILNLKSQSLKSQKSLKIMCKVVCQALFVYENPKSFYFGSSIFIELKTEDFRTKWVLSKLLLKSVCIWSKMISLRWLLQCWYKTSQFVWSLIRCSQFLKITNCELHLLCLGQDLPCAVRLIHPSF